MHSTLSLITAASVCSIPLTSGQPVCKQNGGQRREGSEWSSSRSHKDTTSWDRVWWGNSLSLWQCQQLFPVALSNLLLPIHFSTEWVTCTENKFISHSLVAEWSKVKRLHVLRAFLLMESQGSTGCHMTWHDRESLLTWNLSSSTSEATTTTTVSTRGLHLPIFVKYHQHHLQIQWTWVRGLLPYEDCRHQISTT